MSFGPQPRQRAEEIFAARKEKENFVDYEFKDYKGQSDPSAYKKIFSDEIYRHGAWFCSST